MELKNTHNFLLKSFLLPAVPLSIQSNSKTNCQSSSTFMYLTSLACFVLNDEEILVPKNRLSITAGTEE